ncbi:hypothetical protein AAG570_012207 [Ranatra chinensis]|uniref:Magnesium-dependent phosphatase 1 n=1 Tax=Ranatra chinensis TaxID=642074 RepID=A0ABD0YI46_9HEMI
MYSDKKIPKLVVFDLDYTLWPFWVDTHVTPPFVKRNSSIIDSHGKKVSSYPEVSKVLESFSRLGCDLALASRTGEIDGANQLVSLFGWEHFFKYKEIYPGSKIKHFQNFKRKANIKFEEMLFFDDEYRNIRDVSKLMVVCVLVDNGMTLEVMEHGLKQFSASHHSTCEFSLSL